MIWPLGPEVRSSITPRAPSLGKTAAKKLSTSERAPKELESRFPSPSTHQTDPALETRRVPQPAPACRGVSRLRPGILLGKASRVRPQGRPHPPGKRVFPHHVKPAKSG